MNKTEYVSCFCQSLKEGIQKGAGEVINVGRPEQSVLSSPGNVSVLLGLVPLGEVFRDTRLQSGPQKSWAEGLENIAKGLFAGGYCPEVLV